MRRFDPRDSAPIRGLAFFTPSLPWAVIARPFGAQTAQWGGPFPISTRQAVAVAQGAVRTNDRAAGLSGKLGDEGPVLEPGGLLKQRLKGGAYVHLVQYTLGLQGRNVFVILANGAVRGSYQVVTDHDDGGNTSTLAGEGPSANASRRTVDIVGLHQMIHNGGGDRPRYNSRF
jgi:hypothetical protein